MEVSQQLGPDIVHVAQYLYIAETFPLLQRRMKVKPGIGAQHLWSWQFGRSKVARDDLEPHDP